MIISKKIFAAIILIMFFLISGCTTEYPNRKPIGEMFPKVKGQSLEEKPMIFPNDIAGENVVLLLGYVQNTQFDIDRWLIGLDMTGTQVDVYELPTIQGMFPRFFKTKIDEGMRRGIPKELWKGVVTIYEDGEKVQKFTGNSNSNNARVILLDKYGKVRFFYDEGFSVGAMNSLKAIFMQLKSKKESQI